MTAPSRDESGSLAPSRVKETAAKGKKGEKKRDGERGGGGEERNKKTRERKRKQRIKPGLKARGIPMILTRIDAMAALRPPRFANSNARVSSEVFRVHARAVALLIAE